MILKKDGQVRQVFRYGEGIFGEIQAVHVQDVGLDVTKQTGELIGSLTQRIFNTIVREVIIDAVALNAFGIRRRLNHGNMRAGSGGSFRNIGQRGPPLKHVGIIGSFGNGYKIDLRDMRSRHSLKPRNLRYAKAHEPVGQFQFPRLVVFAVAVTPCRRSA